MYSCPSLLRKKLGQIALRRAGSGSPMVISVVIAFLASVVCAWFLHPCAVLPLLWFADAAGSSLLRKQRTPFASFALFGSHHVKRTELHSAWGLRTRPAQALLGARAPAESPPRGGPPMPKKGKHKGSKGFVFEVAAKCQAVCQADRCECGAALNAGLGLARGSRAPSGAPPEPNPAHTEPHGVAQGAGRAVCVALPRPPEVHLRRCAPALGPQCL